MARAENNRHGLCLLCVLVHLLSGETRRKLLWTVWLNVACTCLCVRMKQFWCMHLLQIVDHSICKNRFNLANMYSLYLQPVLLHRLSQDLVCWHAEIIRVLHMWHSLQRFCSSYADSMHYIKPNSRISWHHTAAAVESHAWDICNELFLGQWVTELV